jgi:hypothetical protein
MTERDVPVLRTSLNTKPARRRKEVSQAIGDGALMPFGASSATCSELKDFPCPTTQASRPHAWGVPDDDPSRFWPALQPRGTLGKRFESASRDAMGTWPHPSLDPSLPRNQGLLRLAEDAFGSRLRLLKGKPADASRLKGAGPTS